ncbi:hypothetical protein [Thiomonas sp. FB-6]|uniref:hypothetical protein n=1 Tax=Thiomonas sp. FB-6 TaxID=1158291 RepID=UPI0003752E71|nr:hypothetical protein [Thiomonas sp. FB-6]
MRRILRALFAAACVAVPLASLWAGGHLQPRLAALALAEYLGSMLVLGMVFGNTLRPGRTALVTRFAAARQPSMSPRLLRYTRGVTAAWTVFFAAMAAASLLLFTLGPLRDWAWFASVGTPLLVACMFVLEYLARRALLSAQEQAGPFEAIRAYLLYRTGAGR